MANATRATNGLRTDQQAGTKMRQLASNRLHGKGLPTPPLTPIQDDALGREALLSGVLTAERRLVLVVEGDPRLRVQLATHLEQMSCCSCCVPNGHAASTATRGSAFDLVMVDAALPDIDGVALVQQLRREGCTSPIVMMASSEAELLTVLQL